MPIKLTSTEQLDGLSEGNLITRFPSQGKAEDKFDESRSSDIDTYEIVSINRNEQSVKLVRAGDALELFTWPGDIERLNIGMSDILSERVWWIV